MFTELIKIIASLWLAVTIHEGGHAVAVKAVGGDVDGFYPYPHNGGLGCVEWTVPKDSVSPVYLGGMAASIASLPALHWAKKKYPNETFFNYWDFWARMDFPYEAISSLWRDGNDISKFCNNEDIPKAVPIALSLVYLKFNKNMLISDGKIFFKKEF